jgi:uncharacterized protein
MVIDVTPAEPILGAPGDRPRLSLAGTLLAALILVLFAGWVSWTHVTQPRVEGVDAPEEALALVVSRGMDLNEGLGRAPAWERRLHQFVTTDGSEDLRQATTWYEELAERSLDPSVDAHLAIMYGEAGDRRRVEKMTAGWLQRGPPLSLLGPIVRTAYEGTAETDEAAERAGLADTGLHGWYADRLAFAWATRVGDASLRAEAGARLQARGRQLLLRVRALAALNLAVVFSGAAALVVMWRRRKRPHALVISRASLPPPWPVGLGIAVLIRGGAGAAVIIVALVFLSGVAGPWFDLDHPLVDMLTWPLMYVPMIVLAHRYLLRPSGVAFGEALGLRLVPNGPRRLLLVAAALVAAGALVSTLLTFVASWAHVSSHWSEWFDEQLAFGSVTAVAASVLGSVVLAPFFEEVVFRGILFASLRGALRPATAIVVSGAIFGGAHGYGALGFVDVAWSGMLWAWAFERTGSVLPGMAAHAITNLLVSITVFTLLR